MEAETGSRQSSVNIHCGWHCLQHTDPGERLKFLQFRHNAINKGIESGTASGAAPPLEKVVEHEATLALT